MGSPRYSPFPTDEYQMRLKKARNLMDKYEFDALLVTAKENVLYFSGLQTVGWDSKHRPLGVILPREGGPTMVIPESLAVVAKETSWVDDVRLWGGFKKPNLPKDPITGIVDALKDLGLSDKRIGMELGYGQRVGMSQDDFDQLKSLVSGATIGDASSLLWDLRMIKSPREIDIMRAVCDATCKAYELGFAAACEGMTERELAGVMMAEMSRLTNYRPGFIGIRSGLLKYPMMNVPPFDKPMEKGDLVVVDSGATLRDYWCDMMRMLCIGKPTDEQRRFFDVELEAQGAGVAAMKPGATAESICQACLDVIEKRGMRQHAPSLERVGHGLGLDVHEPPSMALGNVNPLEPGMILTCEPIFSDLPDYRIGNFALEDVVLITETGHEILTPFPKTLWIA